MKETKKQKSETKKCSLCGKEYLDVGIEPGEEIMVPDCDCNNVSITLDREMLSNLMSYAKNGVTYMKLCNMLEKRDRHKDKFLEPELLQCQSNFCYIQELVEKQVQMNETEFTANPPGSTKVHNLVKQKIETTNIEATTNDTLETEGKKIKLPDGVKVRHRISKDRVCDCCGKSYMENLIVFNGSEFLYSVEPRCRCKEKVGVSLEKADIMYVLGALSLGIWVERMCALFYQAEGGYSDNKSIIYRNIITKVMDEIKTETGIETEYKGYGRNKWILGNMENHINREVEKSCEYRDMDVVNSWESRLEHAREKKGKK